eukprot:12605724-Alexandrium_andersonii.AAC.1
MQSHRCHHIAAMGCKGEGGHEPQEHSFDPTLGLGTTGFGVLELLLAACGGVCVVVVGLPAVAGAVAAVASR